MKKILLLIIPALLLSLAGCSNAESEDKEKEKEQQTQDTTEQDKEKNQGQDSTSTEQYDTSDEYIRNIMKKDPSTLNDEELAVYNEVNSQINNKSELSDSDRAIRADQRAMSKKRNAKSPDEQARIEEDMKKEQQTSENIENGLSQHGQNKELQEIQDSTDRELSQRELVEIYDQQRQDKEPQEQEEQVQQEQQIPNEQQVQQKPGTQTNSLEEPEKEEQTTVEKKPTN
ncbi:hypothetical protein [Staphylococcus xylosus]|uniref:hypothetical protein n=1 Tax=Staphylococcus xylosus TaxID=1288 RepID=UPI003CECCBEE